MEFSPEKKNSLKKCTFWKISWNWIYTRHALPKPPECQHFGELPDVVGGYLTKNLRKCQKSPFLGAKCTNLVTLAETRFQCYQMTALPDMNIFCQILVIFGFFLNFLSNFWQTTSGSSPKCDILEGWQKHVWFCSDFSTHSKHLLFFSKYLNKLIFCSFLNNSWLYCSRLAYTQGTFMKIFCHN